MNKIIKAIILLLVFCASASAQNANTNFRKLRDCDLLFHISATDNAITKVTEGINQLSIDHVGIFFWQDSHPMVIEATCDGVIISPLEKLLSESGSWIAGRVKGKLDHQRTLQNAMEHLGKPYDFTFQRDEHEIYCSELVELSYVLKNGEKVFSPIPMSFHDETGTLLPYWTDFYSRRGLDVPEGMPGSNPGELSRNKQVKMIWKSKR